MDFGGIQSVFRAQELQMSDRECGALVARLLKEKRIKLKHFFSTVCHPQTKHGLPCDRTRAPTMRGRRIFASDIAWPTFSVISCRLLASRGKVTRH